MSTTEASSQGSSPVAGADRVDMELEEAANPAADVAEPLPGSIGSSEIRFRSASDLAAALRRARAAHGARREAHVRRRRLARRRLAGHQLAGRQLAGLVCGLHLGRTGRGGIAAVSEYDVVQRRRRGPVLFCYDGSGGSCEAMRAAAELIDPSVEVIVLSVWEPIAVRLALGGAFAAGAPPNEGDLDEQEESFARAASEEGARRAIEHGFKASALTKGSTEGIARTILALADEISASLIVCGQRGRGP